MPYTSEQPHRQVTPANWQQPDLIHWSFSHVEQILPTATIARGDGPLADLPEHRLDLSGLRVPGPDGEQLTVSDVIDSTDTDAWLVLHQGRIVTEAYFGTTTSTTRHLLQSVSKSLVGSVVGALVARGMIDLALTVGAYVPLLADTDYGTATVRQVLDMRSGMGFREDYLDPHSDSRILEAITGWAPLPEGVDPGSLRGFLRDLRQVRPHGGAFDYRSCETDVLGLVCEGASGEPFTELASRLLWSVIGAESDAQLCVDAEGTGVFDGGWCATIRDLARFGTVIISEGTAGTGHQVLPPAWVGDIFTGGPEATEASVENAVPGGRYRSQFWLPSENRDVALALGIHGQLIYLDRRLGLVGVKLSSWHQASNPWKSAAAVSMFTAIGQYLAASTS